jgi:hypothetical protein
LAAIIKPLHTQCVYEGALSLPLGNPNLLVDNWLQISSYLYRVSPIAIVWHYKFITLITDLTLMGVGTRQSMVEGKDDEAVTYVNSERGSDSLRIVKSVNRLIYISDTDMEEGYQ